MHLTVLVLAWYGDLNSEEYYTMLVNAWGFLESNVGESFLE